MKNKKHLKIQTKSRHSKASNKKKLNIKKFIVFIIILLLIVFGIVKVEQNLTKNENKLSTSNYSEKSITTSKNINGLDIIEVSEINMKRQDNTSYVELKLKNTSNTPQSAFKAHLSILDKDKHILLGIQCSVSEIPANSQISYNIISNDDLINADSYEIIKID